MQASQIFVPVQIPMQRVTVATLAIAICSVAAAQAAASPERAEEAWIARSNSYTNLLLDVQLQHSPEQGSREGVAKFDERISNPTLADELAERHELEAVLVKIDAARAKETDKKVWQDLEILHKAFDLRFRRQDFRLQHEVPFYNASEEVFQGLRGLLDDQVTPERRQAALARLRKYAGMEPGYTPFTESLRQRESEQIAKPGVIYPSKGELDTELGRNSNYVDGIAALFRKYKLTGWEPAYAKLKTELSRLRCLGAGEYTAQGAHGLPPAAAEICARVRAVRHRHPSCENRGHGACGLQGVPGADGPAGRADRQSQRLQRDRLSRGDRGTEEETDHRRCDPAVL